MPARRSAVARNLRLDARSLFLRKQARLASAQRSRRRSRAQDRTVLAIEGGVYDAGAAIEWARRLGLFQDAAALDGFEGPSAASRGIVFVPALSGLAAPFWDRTAAPLFIGMDHATGKQDLVRAVLEGIAMLTAILIDEAGKAAPSHDPISIDGGLSQSGAFAGMIASACGRKILVPPMHELTAIGLAELCGLDIRTKLGNPREYDPGNAISAADRRRFREALALSHGWRR
ncbi:FGGY-family carbohydrate kinase [Ectorhizobium quercum]|uniref:FGGY-family carbohydrate kinase n=1 Tax=Ectorhizobium quercum TaxID=2965071 RepID=UPI003520930E